MFMEHNSITLAVPWHLKTTKDMLVALIEAISWSQATTMIAALLSGTKSWLRTIVGKPRI